MSNRSGFTLIEILLVAVIIGALASIVMPRLGGKTDQAMIAAAKIDITSNVSTALKLYELDNGFFPTTEQGLTALVTKPTTQPVPRNWNGPYLEKFPQDPWGRPYIYKCPGTHGFAYDLYSLGRNNIDDETNINSWD